jgi:hypothetical protein
MVTFQISINGKPYCESDDITAVTMVAEEIGREACRISLHAGSNEASLQWLAADLKAGDEIIIRVLEVQELEFTGPPGCSFCGREIHDVSLLVQGPSASICDRCITGFSAAVKNATELPLGASLRDEPEWVCGFCGTQPGNIPGVVVRNGAALCPECLRACFDILEPIEHAENTD